MKTGSSPQVRGKLSILTETVQRRRLIPAGAGKTFTVFCAIGVVAAHPRRCGENVSLTLGSVDDNGSSPQVRGKLGVYHPVRVSERLIPAGAGKTRDGLSEGSS